MSTASSSRSCARSFPGAEVLFGFLLAIRFTERFEELDDSQRYVYYVTLLSTSTALVLFLATSAHHRLRFRAGDKEFALRKGNRDTIAGTVAAAIAFTGVMYLVTDLVFGTPQAIVASAALFAFIVWRWWAVALYRTWQDRRERDGLRATRSRARRRPRRGGAGRNR